MCLIVFAWKQHDEFPLVLAANRDEYHARAAAPMAWWDDRPSLLAGRDLRAGGTWLGLSRRGHLAAVTNFRENVRSVSEQSRGEIVTGYLGSGDSPATWLSSLNGGAYAGFCALATDGSELAYRSNRGDETRPLDAGVYGLSNSSLDTPWPKLLRTRERLSALLAADALHLDDLLDLMADREPAEAERSKSAELPFQMPREFSAPFIVSPDYGTRCSTAVLCRADGHVEVAERRFNAEGGTSGESRFVFLSSAWAES
ncbi:MAG: NRDE family protein [Woeseiaceae bacterium]|nr:NRDE family protein [Woeseiaceae bacterium]